MLPVHVLEIPFSALTKKGQNRAEYVPLSADFTGSDTIRPSMKMTVRSGTADRNGCLFLTGTPMQQITAAQTAAEQKRGFRIVSQITI
jgi:hypothetical protein